MPSWSNPGTAPRAYRQAYQDALTALKTAEEPRSGHLAFRLRDHHLSVIRTSLTW
jgi:hypothetical protein